MQRDPMLAYALKLMVRGVGSRCPIGFVSWDVAVESWHQDHSQPLHGHPIPKGKWGFFTTTLRSMALNLLW